jgi:ElaB/YqjD/DUF883 family membrane-anchored ribosome-binding protein
MPEAGQGRRPVRMRASAREHRMRWMQGRAEWREEDGGAGYGRGGGRRERGEAHNSLDRPEDVQQLLGDLATMIHGVTLATHDLGRVVGRVRGSITDMADAVGEAWHVTRQHGGGALRAAGHAIDTRPYVAIGLAAALGVIAGYVAQRGIHSLTDPAAHGDDDGWDHFV